MEILLYFLIACALMAVFVGSCYLGVSILVEAIKSLIDYWRNS